MDSHRNRRTKDQAEKSPVPPTAARYRVCPMVWLLQGEDANLGPELPGSAVNDMPQTRRTLSRI